jgi:CBS domain-containing protein
VLTVGQLMWTGITPVTADTPVKEVAALLATSGVPGVPVVDGEGLAIGMVFETDLLGTDRRTGLERRRRAPARPPRRAADVMTSPALGVRAVAPLSLAAELLIERPCFPVLHDGRPVGIVGRAAVAYALSRPDAALEREIESALVLGCSIPRGTLHVEVDAGNVVLRGPGLPKKLERDLPLVIGRLFGVTSLELQLGSGAGNQPAAPPAAAAIASGTG